MLNKLCFLQGICAVGTTADQGPHKDPSYWNRATLSLVTAELRSSHIETIQIHAQPDDGIDIFHMTHWVHLVFCTTSQVKREYVAQSRPILEYYTIKKLQYDSVLFVIVSGLRIMRFEPELAEILIFPQTVQTVQCVVVQSARPSCRLCDLYTLQ